MIRQTPLPFMNAKQYLHSIICLVYELRVCRQESNLLSGKAISTGAVFLSDKGIPLPRPCTALAWASLCSLSPVGGSFDRLAGEVIPFDPAAGNFLLPFLPKIKDGEEQNQSLSRNSAKHQKDPLGQITWGDVYIADASTGVVGLKLLHGNHPANEFMAIAHKRLPLRETNQCRLPFDTGGEASILLPPLHQALGSGWCFGIPQCAGENAFLTLREPMIELARNGIPLCDAISDRLPFRVRRLLLRITSDEIAADWAKAYAEAQRKLRDSEEVQADYEELAEEVLEAKEKRKRAADRVKGKAKSMAAEVFDAFEDFD